MAKSYKRGSGLITHRTGSGQFRKTTLADIGIHNPNDGQVYICNMCNEEFTPLVTTGQCCGVDNKRLKVKIHTPEQQAIIDKINAIRKRAFINRKDIEEIQALEVELRQCITIKEPIIKTAVFKDNVLKHFGVSDITAGLYSDKKEEIITVKFRLANDQSLPDKGYMPKPDYWGFFYKERKDFIFIWDQYMSLDICFPSGIKGAEDAGKGKAYRLEVIGNKYRNVE